MEIVLANFNKRPLSTGFSIPKTLAAIAPAKLPKNDPKEIFGSYCLFELLLKINTLLFKS